MNYALNKPTAESSVFNIGHATKAVDGDRNGQYFGKSCTETNYEADPWWAVNLQESVVVTSVYITNRADCCGEYIISTWHCVTHS